MSAITHASSDDIPSLTGLWREAFGDTEGYIDLFFSSMFRPHDSYVVRVDGEAVSAMYLLDCQIRLDGRLFQGSYVYAAATRREHRNKSYMTRIFNHGVPELADRGMDFVALVPMPASLGDYYARFGFVPTMRKRILSFDLAECSEAAENLVVAKLDVSGSALVKIRDAMIPGPYLRWDERALEYIKACHEFGGGECVVFGESSYAFVAVTGDEAIVSELICPPDELSAMARALMERYQRNRCVIHTFHPAGVLDLPFGMTLFLSDRIKRAYHGEPIYMNLALD